MTMHAPFMLLSLALRISQPTMIRKSREVGTSVNPQSQSQKVSHAWPVVAPSNGQPPLYVPVKPQAEVWGVQYLLSVMPTATVVPSIVNHIDGTFWAAGAPAWLAE